MEKALLGQCTMPGIGFGTLGNTGDAAIALVEMAAISALARGMRIVNPKHGPAWGPA